MKMFPFLIYSFISFLLDLNYLFHMGLHLYVLLVMTQNLTLRTTRNKTRANLKYLN